MITLLCLPNFLRCSFSEFYDVHKWLLSKIVTSLTPYIQYQKTHQNSQYHSDTIIIYCHIFLILYFNVFIYYLIVFEDNLILFTILFCFADTLYLFFLIWWLWLYWIFMLCIIFYKVFALFLGLFCICEVLFEVCFVV